MGRAIFHGLACLYYRWAMAAMRPTHPDHGYVVILHALHKIEFHAWLRGEG